MDESNYIKSKGFLVHERCCRQRLEKDESGSCWQFQNQPGIPGIFKEVLQIERRQTASIEKRGDGVKRQFTEEESPKTSEQIKSHSNKY